MYRTSGGPVDVAQFGLIAILLYGMMAMSMAVAIYGVLSLAAKTKRFRFWR